ncbi:collagen-binding domain-containing protein [Agromyces archimandritae]|uniref:Choice-of-anchor A family protein n=1 Tax=Agromyces archimandritae TaxID=2781962 RepID=A0A975FP37_9MICO|nr:collagen-binding domain-containing protein [Agromyces archimandritae]QTX05755.1 choice-of-anchor A family protein [Agromyces archimandritae]
MTRTRTRNRTIGALGALALGGLIALPGLVPPTAEAAPIAAVNPVTLGERANSGFLVFVRGDVQLGPSSDEAEGTIAAGGDLRFHQAYNVAAGRPPASTFRSPGDDADTYLYVGGRVSWGASSSALSIHNGGYVKIAGGDFDVLHKNPNSTEIVRPGETSPDASPRIFNDRIAQPAASVADTTGAPDFDAAFARYTELSSGFGQCTPSNELLDGPGENALPVPRPIDRHVSQVYLDLIPGRTNVVTMTGAELANIDQIGFLNGQRATRDTPVLINIVGGDFEGPIPRQGWDASQAPYVLFNFPDASRVHVTANTAELNGTLYAPAARVAWQATQNISGNVIAAEFVHGLDRAAGLAGHSRELHELPFDAELSCDENTGRLTLVKEVLGSDEDPRSWTLTGTAADGETISGSTGDPAVTGAEVPAGQHVLEESGGPADVDDYVVGGWMCGPRGEEGSLVMEGGVVTVPPGGDIVCTIVNTYAPPTPEPTPTPTPEPGPSPTPGPTETPEPSPTPGPTETPEPAPTPTPPVTPTPTPTEPEPTEPEPTTPGPTTPGPAPETNAPETTEPETTAPETTAPETTAPETSAPETTAPETSAPAPGSTEPETPAPAPATPSPGPGGVAGTGVDPWPLAGLAAILLAAGLGFALRRRPSTHD